ncbi:MAG: tetratricopeptide repeat protein [Treponema sp.]|jgi:tetratricopeptide (TPR) repeat protein|nr:tetratricopeptide repeat protein [Treponema sp.]
MLRDPLLNKALDLMRRGKYDSAIKMLESEVFRHQESFQYYHILGLCCLYAGDLGGSFTYFNRAKNIKFRESGPLLGLAFYFLKRGDTERAVDLYLDVQDIDEKNKIARRALELIRKSGGGENISGWTQGGRARRFFPPIPAAPFKWKTLAIPLAALFGAAVVTGAVTALRSREPAFEREGLEGSVLADEEKASAVETGGTYRYILTTDEVIGIYDEARVFFNEYRDEKAKYNLNRILESNAASPVKNKARLLKSYTKVPGFDTLKDFFSYREAAAEPPLYRDCYVVWKGMAANVVEEEYAVSFDLLVGYDTRRVMEGAVPVAIDFPAEINTSQPLEVLGKIVILPGPKDLIALEAAGIHQITGAGQ